MQQVTAAMSLGKKLKTFTAAHHDHIEQHPLTQAITAGTITLPQYKHFLSKFYGFYSACEPALASTPLWEKMEFDIFQRFKTPLLVRDLAFLNIDHKQLPICPQVPLLQSDAQRLGYLYVVEGATLGGQFLSRALFKRFGFSPSNGAAYFNSYGTEHIGRMWKEFQHLLEQFHCLYPETEQEILHTAALTFQYLENWLSL